jgi:hypothetical protein
MNQDLKNIRFEMWVDDNSETGTQRSVCAFHINRKDNSSKGLGYVWFVLSDIELNSLSMGKVESLKDGYHNLNVSGDYCTFYDLEYPRDNCGVLSVPYMRLELPRVFWRYLERIAKITWRSLRAFNEACKGDRYYSGRRIEIDIPLATLERFQLRYGSGKGEVECQYSPRLIEEMSLRPQLKEKVQQVETIARNYTRSKYHIVVASIQNDGNGYYFSTRDHKNRRGLNGGIVNHSKEMSGNNWSIHT